MRVAFSTLGCRLNQFETDALERMLQEAGYRVVGFSEEADLYIINTCTITHEADADSRQTVRRAVRQNPKALVVVTGCYANVAPQVVASIPGVDLVLGNAEKARFLDYLQSLTKGAPQVAVGEFPKRPPFVPLKPSTDPRRSRAYLKIQDGCNYRCAFCIVPQVRGRSRSLPVEAVLGQLDELVQAGLPEIVLTGIHLGTYGWDLSPPTSLAKLVEAMIPHLGQARLRLSSLDPHEVHDDLIALMKAHQDRICRHLHLPVQSGDPKILRLMRRAHTAEDFRHLVLRLVEEIPGIALGSDVIVGFPQEGEGEFENTYRLLDSLPITYLHVFSYSRRAGTEAWGMPGQVPEPVKVKRSKALRALSARKAMAFRKSFVGQALPVVVLSERDKQTGNLVGLSDNYIKVHVEGPDALRNRWAVVLVEEATGFGAKGRFLLAEEGF